MIVNNAPLYAGSGTEFLPLPSVLRARDFHLYLDGGRRLTDLWQLGGKAILGHKPQRVLVELKNNAERGLFAPLPHPAENRFFKALGRLFPPREDGLQFSFRLYKDEASLGSALEKAGFPPSQITDPVFGSPRGEAPQLSLWRPFLETASAPLQVPVLPWAFSPLALVIEKSMENRFPNGDLLSPAILAPAARSIYDLIAAGTNRGSPRYQRIKKTLSKRQCKWQHQGIYLCRSPETYSGWKRLWMHFLENGFLLPPSPGEPLILPGILSQGEEAHLADLLEYE